MLSDKRDVTKVQARRGESSTGLAFSSDDSNERARRAKEEETSGRFTRHGWRVDVYIDFLGLAATAGKLAAEEEEGHGRNDDHKDHKYGHDCCAATTTIIISHEINPPF
jgi:hypothetical protein